METHNTFKEKSIVEENSSTTSSWTIWDYLPSWRPTSEDIHFNIEKEILKKSEIEYKQVFVEAGEHKINTIITGSGPPLVLLHGFAAGLAIWISNYKELSKHYTIYSIDLPGFGRNTRVPFKGKTVEEAEEYFLIAIELWREKLHLNKFYIIGHSFGGYLSSIYSMRYPEYIEHLCLADPWGIAIPNPEWTKRFPIHYRMLKVLLENFNPLASIRAAGPLGPIIFKKARSDIEIKFKEFFEDTSIISSYIYHSNAKDPSGETAFFYLNSEIGWAKNPLCDRLHELDESIPITIIFGENSWKDRKAGHELANKLGSRANYHLISNSAHHVYIDNYIDFNKVVLSCLKQRNRSFNNKN